MKANFIADQDFSIDGNKILKNQIVKIYEDIDSYKKSKVGQNLYENYFFVSCSNKQIPNGVSYEWVSSGNVIEIKNQLKENINTKIRRSDMSENILPIKERIKIVAMDGSEYLLEPGDHIQVLESVRKTDVVRERVKVNNKRKESTSDLKITVFNMNRATRVLDIAGIGFDQRANTLMFDDFQSYEDACFELGRLGVKFSEKKKKQVNPIKEKKKKSYLKQGWN